MDTPYSDACRDPTTLTHTGDFGGLRPAM